MGRRGRTHKQLLDNVKQKRDTGFLRMVTTISKDISASIFCAERWKSTHFDWKRLLIRKT
jgi:hypothetical protein